MGFLNPLMLWGMAAISVPILIHLLSKRRIQRVHWGAMRFLQLTVEQNQRQLNLEDLLLLILRCLLLILLALALARPAIQGGALSAFGAGGGARQVLAVDDSYSMSQTDGVTSSFDKAKTAAEQAIDAAGAGSAAAVMFGSDMVRKAVPEPTFDLNLARKSIRDAPLTDRPTDLLPTVREGLETLKKAGGGRRELFLFTDGQAAGFRRLQEICSLLAENRDIQTRIVFAGEPLPRNLAVTDLRMASAMAWVNTPVRFEVQVTNFGSEEAQDVPVRLSVDGEPALDESVIATIPAGQAKSISLYAKLRTPGYHGVAASIPADHLPADDSRTFALRAMDDIQVLIVEGDYNAEPRETGAFFLKNAFAPVPAAEQDQFVVKPKVISPSELDGQKLEDYEAVVLSNVGVVSERTLSAVERYLKQGGGLLIFPGDRTDAGFLNKELVEKRQILPASLGQRIGDSEKQDKFVQLQDRNYEHPITAIWNDPGAGSLGSARFYEHYQLTPAEGTPENKPRTILTYRDGAPAVLERNVGEGRAFLFSAPANTKWSDLSVRGAFLPLLHRVLGAILQRSDSRLNGPVGSEFVFPVPAELVGKEVAIYPPKLNDDRPRLQQVAVEQGRPVVRFNQTDFSGLYKVKMPGEGSELLLFATQPDPLESRIAAINDVQKTELKNAGAQVIDWTPDLQLRDVLEKQRSGAEFWMTLAFLALLVAVAEMVLANWFSRPK